MGAARAMLAARASDARRRAAEWKSLRRVYGEADAKPVLTYRQRDCIVQYTSEVRR